MLQVEEPMPWAKINEAPMGTFGRERSDAAC
jgi:hypothetical protein